MISLLKIKPMLAHKVSEELDFNQVLFIQPKLDGVRCVINKDGAFSRNGKEFMNVEHIKDELAPLFAYAPELTLDGELYNHDLREDFNKIISLVRKSVNISKEDRDEAKATIQFHCYDVIDDNRPSLSYIERDDMIRHILEYKYKTKYSVIVDTKVIKSQEELDTYHNQNKNRGFEGSIVRTNKAYEQKRSKSLMKVKDWHDTEITVTGYVEGKGKFEQGLGKFLGRDEDNREVEVPFPSLTIPQRRDYWKRRESFIGKELTFEYFERTPDGAYRFPRAKSFRNYE